MKSLGHSAPAVETIDDRIRAIVRHEIARAHLNGARHLSQYDGERPAGTKRQRYLDVHALAFAARDPGATKIGRARLFTSDAWARWATALPSRKKVTPPTPISLDDEVCAELGVERTAS